SRRDWRSGDSSRGGVPVACARRRIYLNGTVLDHAVRVVVHSPWCLDRVRELEPEHAGRTVVIPMGASARVVTAEHRAAIRARFGLPAAALIFGSFGFLSMGKMNLETIAAFATVARTIPSALLMF